MNKSRLVASCLLSTIGLIGTNRLALADSIGRYERTIMGAIGLEPIGARDGHLLQPIINLKLQPQHTARRARTL